MQFIQFQKFCQKNQLNIFTIHDIKILFDQASPAYVCLKVNRWIQKGYLKSIKRGLYIFADQNPDEFEIASHLITPSYISLTSALSHYSLIPDVSAEVSSVTTKNTAQFQIQNTRYQFFHIKPSLFSDFVGLRDNIFMATPEKAILDYFYFKNPEPSDIFFERLNPLAFKSLNLKKMIKQVQNFPAATQTIYNHFLHVISH